MLSNFAGKVILFLLVTCVFAQQHCPLGEGFNSQGVCAPCAIDHCGYCSTSEILSCQACIPPYQLDPQSNNCRCPIGMGPLANGGCTLCEVSHCSYCSSAKAPACEVCEPNFTAKKTSAGVQCICEAPFQINQNGQCSCLPGFGFDSQTGCAKCDINNCQVCGNSDSSTCQKCFLTAQLSADNSSCSCPYGQGPISGLGCAACRPKNCASCSNSILDRCDVCAQNFTKTVTATRTTCTCQAPFILRADGRCVCPAGQGSDGQGGCMTCSISNCASCKISNYGICEVCKPTYTLSADGTSCGCLSGQGQLMQGGCAKCQVEHCVSCSNGFQNACDQCEQNFVNLVTGNSTQCLCKAPFYVNEEGVCGCPPGKYQSGPNQCSACQVNNCLECSDNGTVCSKCQSTYLLEGNECSCISFEGPLNGGRCAPCADSNCEECENSAVDVCSKCSGNLTLEVLDYDNETNQVQQTICSCESPFVTDQAGNCVCPPGKALNSQGSCQLCAVIGCSSCDQGNQLCSACFAPFVVNSNGDACVCPVGTATVNGTCVKCQIENCANCPNPYEDTCSFCVGNFTLTAADNQESVDILNKTDQFSMNTAVCSCESPFILNDVGLCVCPIGMTLNSQGTCVACTVQFCNYCEQSNVCNVCKETMILNSNGQCVCPQGLGLNKEGRCDDCALSNCLSCANAEQLNCQACAVNFTLVITQANGIENHECQCSAPYTLTSTGVCIFECPPGTVEDGTGICAPCEVNNCDTCSSSSVFSCNSCLSPFVLTADSRQCSCPIGQGPENNGCATCKNTRCASCPIKLDVCYQCQAPYRLNENGECVCPIGSGQNAKGQCMMCKVDNCDQCESSDSPQCVKCIYPASLSSDKSKCVCPAGQVMAPGGSCTPCSVAHCQQCESALSRECLNCKPTFALSETAQQCKCPEGEGPNHLGVCEKCFVYNCDQCHVSAFTCSNCQHPFISNSDGTACVCPVGFAPNDQGGCSECQVDYCSSCPTSTQLLCDSCFPMYQLGLNGTFCFWPNENMQLCPPGQGLNLTTKECEFCTVPYCLKCYVSSQTCSICQEPFVSNANGTACVCPKGMATNEQGGCSYCSVNDCIKCTSSEATTCEKCYFPFKLVNNDQECQFPQRKKKHHFLSDIIHGAQIAAMFMAETPQESFNLGIVFGMLVFPILLLGLLGLIYVCWSKSNNSRSRNVANSENRQSESSISSQRNYSRLVE